MSDVDKFKYKSLQVWNMTDGFPATEEWFETPEEAKQFIKEFRKRFRDTQGYYLNHRQERMDPDEVNLKIKGTYLGRRYRDDD